MITALRYGLLLSAGFALSACTTMDDPKLGAKDLTAQNGTAATPLATAEPAADPVAQTVAVANAEKSAEAAPVLALAATEGGDPALPQQVPLPMFRQAASEALIANATPSLPAVTAAASVKAGQPVEPGEVQYSGVTKSGTANHLVEARADIAATSKPQLHNLIGQYAAAYQVPERLVHRVVQRESRYNPAARNGPYFGLMQISHATARGMGYSGTPQGLLNANTNLRYAVKYLAGAYKVAGGNETQAVRFYARGYYYDAKRKGLLEETGLRKGPNSLQTAFIEPGAPTVTAQTDPMVTQSLRKSSVAAASAKQPKILRNTLSER